MHDADDAAVWGSGLGRREHWPRWLLMSAAGVGLVGMSGIVPGSRSPLVRLAVAAAVGWLVGDYMAMELVPGQAVLQVRHGCLASLGYTLQVFHVMHGQGLRVKHGQGSTGLEVQARKPPAHGSVEMGAKRVHTRCAACFLSAVTSSCMPLLHRAICAGVLDRSTDPRQCW